MMGESFAEFTDSDEVRTMMMVELEYQRDTEDMLGFFASRQSVEIKFRSGHLVPKDSLIEDA